MTEPSLILIAALCLVVALGLWRALKSPQERSQRVGWQLLSERIRREGFIRNGINPDRSLAEQLYDHPRSAFIDCAMLEDLEPNWDWPRRDLHG